MKLSKNDKILIEEAVREAESKTSGEIVPVILKKSDFYPAAHFRLAIMISFLAGVILYYLPMGLDDPMMILWIQIPGLLLGYFLTYIPFLKRFFSTSKEIKEEVHQRALESFFENNLHTTQFRTGILILVSNMEKRVEILADVGINEKVKKKEWKRIVDVLLTKIKSNEEVEGLCEAIKECGELLKEQFPIQEGDINELPNALVTDMDQKE